MPRTAMPRRLAMSSLLVAITAGPVAAQPAMSSQCCVAIRPAPAQAAPLLRFDAVPATNSPFGAPVAPQNRFAIPADPARPLPAAALVGTPTRAPGVAMTFTSPTPIAGGTASLSITVRPGESYP